MNQKNMGKQNNLQEDSEREIQELKKYSQKLV